MLIDFVSSVTNKTEGLSTIDVKDVETDSHTRIPLELLQHIKEQ